MAQQNINLGSTANDGTGDPLRSGGEKINSNFTELYGRTQNLEDNQVTGVVQYSTLAELPTTGTLNVSYKITNDGSNNGYYHWNGATYIKDADLVINTVDGRNSSDALGGEGVSNHSVFYSEPLVNSNTQILVDYIGNSPSVEVNGSSYFINTVSNVLECTVTGASTGLKWAGVLESGVDYYVRLQVKIKSGDTGKSWSFGYPVIGSQSVSFTPDSSWQTIEGSFNTTNVSFGALLTVMEAANQTIEIKELSIKKRNFYEDSNEARLNSVGAINPVDFDLQTALSLSDNVFIPVGTHIITSTINVTSGKTIYGVRGKSILQADASLAVMLSINTVNDVTLKDFTIKGTFPDVTLGAPLDTPIAGTVDTFEEAILENGKGTKVGLFINAAERINISGMIIQNWDYYGMYVTLSGKSYSYGIKVTDNYFNNNYCNLSTSQEAEYSSYVGNSFTLSQIGLRVETGNNIFSNNHIDKNRVGLVMVNGLNDSHGAFSNCTFNHNSLYGIALEELTNGEVFSSCEIWYSNIYVRNSKGILFNGCQLAALSLFADGNKSGGGMWMISNCIIMGDVYINQNYLGNTSDLRMRNNHLADGTDSSAYNN